MEVFYMQCRRKQSQNDPKKKKKETNKANVTKTCTKIRETELKPCASKVSFQQSGRET